MLLPSAISCDASQPARNARYQVNALFASPPVSPQPATATKFTNIYSTCRALQSMLSAVPAAPAQTQQMSPPLEQEPTLPTARTTRLRLRNRSNATGAADGPDFTYLSRPRITKRTLPAARGVNKRRRPIDDHDGREDDATASETDATSDVEPTGPATPKRMRFGPEIVPRGLERSDFKSLQQQQALAAVATTTHPANDAEQTSSISGSADHDDEWTVEDDRVLVELVLEKLKLSKNDWHDCARSLGKDRHSVGRRWKSLMIGGEIGLKRPARSRARIHGTWR